MCDIETLRLFVNERLTAVAEDILAVFVRTIVQYQQQIDVQHRHGVTSELADILHPPVCKEEGSPEHQQLSSSPIPEEIKEEHEETCHRPQGAHVSTMTLRSVKSEHTIRETEPLASTSTEHMKTRADVEYCGTSQPTGDVQLLSSESDTEDSDEWEQTREDQPALNAVKSHKTRAVGGQRSSSSNKVSQEPNASSTEKTPFSCTVCGKRFNQPGNLKMHMRTHRGQDQATDSSSPWGQTASWQSGPPSIPNNDEEEDDPATAEEYIPLDFADLDLRPGEGQQPGDVAAYVARHRRRPQPARRSRVVPVPHVSVRTLSAGHLPEMVDLKNPKRCREQGCSGKTRVRCTTCNVFLCLQGRNCYAAFHTGR